MKDCCPRFMFGDGTHDLDCVRLRAGIARPVGCRSDAELGEILDGIVVRATGLADMELKAAAPDAKALSRELITSVRGGQHVELAVRAVVYRQKKGQPNRRFLRFAVDQLAAIAASFVGMPFLVDHNASEQGARKGTILSSELITDSRGMSSFVMTFSVVKPEAVISILDGTLDRFSIGWFPTGKVNCSVHKTDVRGPSACSCWPGDTVEVDGKSQIVEYEFQSAEGKELSGVNVPAVRGTRIDDIRAALTAELSLPPKRERVMLFPRSSLVVGFELGDSSDERLAAFVENLVRGKAAAEQERDRAIAETKEAKTALTAVTATAGKHRVDTLIAGAYTSGKLRYARDEAGAALPSKREARLRALATRDGIDALAVEIEELDVLVPVGERQLSAAIVEPERTPSGVLSAEDNPYLAVAARELGIPLEELKANARQFGNGT